MKNYEKQRFQNSLLQMNVWWDEENQIARADGEGIVDEMAAQWVYEQTDSIGQELVGQVDWILDMSRLVKPTAKARKILAKTMALPSIHQYAMVGASVFLRTIANFINAAAGVTNAQHFSSEEEALSWLKSEA